MLYVMKVGGSLYDWPLLPAALRAFLTGPPDTDGIVIIPGGGATADAIRAFDQTFHLGTEESHWLAIRALSLNARLLTAILPEAQLIEEPRIAESWRGVGVLDPMPILKADEANADHFPHHWDVTSDSLALRIAILLNAQELTLFKSTDSSFTSWPEASETGIVDKYFATAMQAAPASLGIRVVNLRRWQAERSYESVPPGP